MNDDIVTRLKDEAFLNRCGHGEKITTAELMEKAANEIERLRKIIKDFYFSETAYQEACQNILDEKLQIVSFALESQIAWEELKKEATK